MINLRGPGGPDIADHENRFFGGFWKGRSRSTSCFLPHRKKSIVAKVITGQRSAPAFVYFYCTHEFQTWFAANHHFSNFKIYLLLQFLSNHLQTFRICSRHQNKENDRTKFCFRPLNSSYWILKILGLFFDDFLGPKIFKIQ